MNLRDYLYKNGLKQSDFARMLNVTTPHLCCVINGKRKTSNKLAKSIEVATGGVVKARDVLSGKGSKGGTNKRMTDKKKGIDKKDCKEVYSLI